MRTVGLLMAHTAGWVLLSAVLWVLAAGDTLSLLQMVAMQAAAITAVTALLWRGWQRRTWQALGLRKAHTAWQDIAAGFLMAGVAQTAILLLLLTTGAAEVHWLASAGRGMAGMLGEALLLWVLVAWNEELLARGYWLHTVAEGYWQAAARRARTLTTARPGAMGRLLGALVSSALFALLHAMNAHVSASALVGIFVGGMFLAYGYVCSDALWLPMGMHLGWNFFEGTVYGFPVSGMGVPHVLFTSLTGPEWFTGGAFGPEAGAVSVPALLLLFGMIVLYTSRGRNGEHKKRCVERLKDSFSSLAAMIGFRRG